MVVEAAQVVAILLAAESARLTKSEFSTMIYACRPVMEVPSRFSVRYVAFFVAAL